MILLLSVCIVYILSKKYYIVNYIMKQFEEAYDLLKTKNDTSNNAKLLEAQVLYRMGRYEDSLKVYQGLTKSVGLSIEC